MCASAHCHNKHTCAACTHLPRMSMFMRAFSLSSLACSSRCAAPTLGLVRSRSARACA